MSETMRMWVEISFNLVYLIVVWGLVIAMQRRRASAKPADRAAADYVRWAFALLALGDTGHVGFRLLAYAFGGLEITFRLFGLQFGLVGLGSLATAFTVTLFYVLMLETWRSRFEGSYGWLEYVLLGAAVARLLLMVHPANDWNRVVPPQPWASYRNLPLILLGLGVAYLILRDARAAQDRTFLWIGVMILVSYACYVPVVFFVQRLPLLGMMMIPKTVAYLVIGLVVYRDLYDPADPALAAAGSASA